MEADDESVRSGNVLRIGQETASGLWTMQNDEIAISGGMRSGNSPPRTTRMRFIVYDSKIWRKTQDHQESEVGFVDLFVPDGGQIPIGIVNIEIKKGLRRGGYGRKVVDALVATAKANGKHFFASDILPKAKGFWKSTGGRFASGTSSELIRGDAPQYATYNNARGANNMMYNAPETNRPLRLRGFRSIAEEIMGTPEIPDWVAERFGELGEQQRGVPERVMVRAQHVIGGGVMNVIIEHAGDLIHRATHMLPRHNNALRYLAVEKINKVKHFLFHSYGFEREFEENMRANAIYHSEKDRINDIDSSLEKHRAEVLSVLRRYAHAHSELPAYNQYHFDCREMCVAIGRLQLPVARMYCTSLDGIISDAKRFERVVREYKEISPGVLETL